MKALSKLFLGMVILTAALSVQAAQKATPDWENAVGDCCGYSDFNSATLSFTPFRASALTEITNAAGYWHTHSGTATVYVEIELNGQWTSVYTSTNQVWPDTPMSSIDTPISFPAGMVSAVRVRMNPGQDQSFHNFQPDMQFIFDGETPVIPTLSPLSLLALFGALMLLGMIVIRRRGILKH
jgi:hypothetical protein